MNALAVKLLDNGLYMHDMFVNFFSSRPAYECFALCKLVKMCSFIFLANFFSFFQHFEGRKGWENEAKGKNMNKMVENS